MIPATEIKTHGIPSAYNRGCRCPACREQHRQRMIVQRGVLAARPREEVPHGLGGYNNWHCRCDICFQANADACRQWRLDRKRKALEAAGAG